MSRFVLPVFVQRDADGYFAMCPTLQGCYTQGETCEKVLLNIEDAIRLHIEDLQADGQTIPTSDMVSLTTVEISA